MIPYLIAGAIGFVVAKIFDEDEEPKYADGGSVLLAPNGKPSNLTPEQYKLVRSKAFISWFGDWENDKKNASKVLDENREPLIVWHTSPNEFNIFDFDYSDIFGFHFGTKKASEDILKVRLKNKGNSKPYFLNIRKKLKIKDTKDHKSPYSLYSQPYSLWDKINIGDFDISSSYDGSKYIKKEVDRIKKAVQNNKNYDGYFYENKYEDIGSISWVVGNSNQIKLADGSNTTFDANNPDIRFDGGGEIESVIQQAELDLSYLLYKQNIEYHSLYAKLKNLDFFDDDDKVTSTLVKGFINDVKTKSQFINGKILLYRALAIKNIEKLNVEKLGIYWSVNEDKTGVFDDEGYEHKEKPNYKSVFIIRAEFNTNDIDWQNSFDLYVMNDWMEGEIRVFVGSEAFNLKIKKSGDKKWLNI